MKNLWQCVEPGFFVPLKNEIEWWAAVFSFLMAYSVNYYRLLSNIRVDGKAEDANLIMQSCFEYEYQKWYYFKSHYLDRDQEEH